MRHRCREPRRSSTSPSPRASRWWPAGRQRRGPSPGCGTARSGVVVLETDVETGHGDGNAGTQLERLTGAHVGAIHRLLELTVGCAAIGRRGVAEVALLALVDDAVAADA